MGWLNVVRNVRFAFDRMDKARLVRENRITGYLPYF